MIDPGAVPTWRALFYYQQQICLGPLTRSQEKNSLCLSGMVGPFLVGLLGFDVASSAGFAKVVLLPLYVSCRRTWTWKGVCFQINYIIKYMDGTWDSRAENVTRGSTGLEDGRGGWLNFLCHKYLANDWTPGLLWARNSVDVPHGL